MLSLGVFLRVFLGYFVFDTPYGTLKILRLQVFDRPPLPITAPQTGIKKPLES